MRLCSIVGCGRKHYAKTYCQKHYDLWRRRGSAEAEPNRLYTPEERFRTYTEWQGDCLVWTKATDSDGYGIIRVGDSYKGSHRYAWERVHGTLPPEIKIDHTCHNRVCVNIKHLRESTNAENTRNRKSGHGSTGHRNVYHTTDGKYMVIITLNGKRYYFGRFSDIEEAAKVAEQKRKELFGEFAGKG